MGKGEFVVELGVFQVENPQLALGVQVGGQGGLHGRKYAARPPAGWK